MKLCRLVVICGFFFWWAVFPVAAAQTLTERMDRIQRDLQAQFDEFERDHPAPGKNKSYHQHRQSLRDALNYLQYSRQHLEAGQLNEALDGLHKVQFNNAVRPDIRENVAAAADGVSKTLAPPSPSGATPTAAPDAAREFADKADAIIKEAGEKARAAKEPRDLDECITKVQRLRETRFDAPTTRAQGRLIEDLQNTVTFLHKWQDYLAAKSRQDGQGVYDAMQYLSNLTARSDVTSPIPRSEILALMPAAPMSHLGLNASEEDRKFAAENDAAVEQILRQTRTADELPAAIAKLDELRARLAGNPAYNENFSSPGLFRSSLEGLEAKREELRSGKATLLAIAPVGQRAGARPSALSAQYMRLWVQLLETALARVLGAPEEKPAADEAFAPFLRRLMEAARQRGDWDAVARGADFDQTLTASPGYYTPLDNSIEREAYREFASGRNMEAAGQYQQAATAYLHALKSGEQGLPTALIGERLTAIQHAHPDDYAAANTFVLNEKALPTPMPDKAVRPVPTVDLFTRSSRQSKAYFLEVPALPSAAPTPTSQATP